MNIFHWGNLIKVMMVFFQFEVSIPKELNNEFNMTETSVKWLFATQEIIDENNGETVKTGDETNIRMLLGIFIGARELF